MQNAVERWLLSICFRIRLVTTYTDMFYRWAGKIGADSQSILDTHFGGNKDGPAAHLRMVFPSRLPLLDPTIPEWDFFLTEIRNTL